MSELDSNTNHKIISGNSQSLYATLVIFANDCYRKTCLTVSNAYVDEKGCSLIFYGLETNSHFMGIDDIFGD